MKTGTCSSFHCLTDGEQCSVSLKSLNYSVVPCELEVVAGHLRTREPGNQIMLPSSFWQEGATGMPVTSGWGCLRGEAGLRPGGRCTPQSRDVLSSEEGLPTHSTLQHSQSLLCKAHVHTHRKSQLQRQAQTPNQQTFQQSRTWSRKNGHLWHKDF